MDTDIAEASSVSEASKSIMPFLGGDVTGERKASYLSYRFTGFSFREACALAEIHQKTILRWRKEGSEWYDPKFAELEVASTGPDRAKHRKEVIALLFTRNYHLVLRRDYEILMKSLGQVMKEEDDGFEYPVMPTQEETNYLLKSRSHYTPSQIEVLEKLLDPTQTEEFSLSEFLLNITRTQTEEKIQLAGRVVSE